MSDNESQRRLHFNEVVDSKTETNPNRFVVVKKLSNCLKDLRLSGVMSKSAFCISENKSAD